VTRWWPRPAPVCTRSMCWSPERRLDSVSVVLFFEFLLVAAVVVITWFAFYALYRLVTDES